MFSFENGVDLPVKDIFIPGSILLPRDADMERWSVIACDQFTSQPEYWAEVERLVGDAPSTLRLMLPEAYLDLPDKAERSGAILAAMEDYLARGLFRTLEDSYIYVERTLSGGGLRRGLLGLLDLEAYDYREDSTSLVHATEGLVQERIPPRLALREKAVLESSHLVLFYDDPEFQIPALAAGYAGETLYDFPLMLGGGHIRGLRITGKGAEKLRACLNRMGESEVLAKKYGGAASPVLYAVGDGNHSLATAKQHWERIRETLSPARREHHPARYALAELVDLHEPAIEFEPIHRVLFQTDAEDFFAEAEARFPEETGEHPFQCMTAGGSHTMYARGTIGESIAALDAFLRDYAARHGGRIDYIHGLEDARTLCSGPDRAAILMPEMDKRDLFPSIVKSGPLSKKSFSIGPALDKRYYLECRKIV